ncbi:hypothetical protein [Streptomyces sp. WZ-12]|uniref:hypothetical protein n=1 Tax=Streptomyces sp. WZ-12 TaxID=3030210 RepID=UPI002381160B|nr:hypothetical protein [Streptomyces sp. WZ-12]
MRPEKQGELIVAIAALGGDLRTPVSKDVLAAHTGLSPHTLAGTRGFFEQAGLIEAGRGVWAVTEVGLRFARLRATDSARSRLLLREHWQEMWFHKAALRLLQEGPLEEWDFANRLGEGLSSGRERRLYLVEWLVHALLVHREDGMIVAPSSSADSARPQTSAPFIFDPLMTMTDEEITALPTDRFVALMDTYRTLFTDLTSPSARSAAV